MEKEKKMIREGQIEFEMKASYASYGNLSSETEHIWVVFHGYGQLAKYFIRRFDILNPNQHFVLAPQGLSRFYVKGLFGTVGASWMTKEDRETDIKNQQVYLNAIFAQSTAHVNWDRVRLHILGFSQGVATACRWVFQQEQSFDRLILWSGEFPPDIDRALALKPEAEIWALIGDQDPLFDVETWKKQLTRIEKYARKPRTHIFEGKHEITREVLRMFA